MKKTKLAALVLAGCIAAMPLAGCGREAAEEAPEGQRMSHLKILGTEGWVPCNNWNEVGEYSAFQKLQGLLAQADLEIEWEVIPTEKYPMMLQTRLASDKNLPDIAKAHTMDDAALLELAKQGVILPINKIVEEYSAGPAREAFDKVFPTVRPLTTAEDGNIYWFCNMQNKFYNGNPNANGSFSIQYRRDWADQLGIPEPETLEEFTEMLRAFREKDANGNQEKDEILFIDPGSFRTAIAQWFDLPTGTIGLDPQNQRITSPWKSPYVKDYFAYLNGLVNEGILDPDVAGNYDLLEQKRAQNKISAIWDYPDAMWNDAAVQPAAPEARYVPLMPLPAVPGVQPAAMSEPGDMVWERYVVTRACTDLKAVARLLDLICSEEYSILTTYGQEGINFVYEKGEIKPLPNLTFDVLKKQRLAEGAILWNGVLPRVQYVNMGTGSDSCDAEKRSVALALVGYEKTYPDQINNFLALPTSEESARINELQENLDIASQELAWKLTLGQIPLSELEKEVEKLDQLGLTELMGIAQARYDRYLEKMP